MGYLFHVRQLKCAWLKCDISFITAAQTQPANCKKPLQALYKQLFLHQDEAFWSVTGCKNLFRISVFKVPHPSWLTQSKFRLL